MNIDKQKDMIDKNQREIERLERLGDRLKKELEDYEDSRVSYSITDAKMLEKKNYTEEEILLSYKGRCLSDEEDLQGGYCGSCSIEVHRMQLADPKSWVHGSVLRWIDKAKPKPTVEELQAELEIYKDLYIHASEEASTQYRFYADEVDKHRWIPVSERLPEKTAWVLVYQDGAVRCRGWRPDKEEWQDWEESCCSGITENLITHWKPIILPEQEKENINA